MPEETATPPTLQEIWWTEHARLLAKYMKVSGVASFRVALTERGTYEFEVVPTAMKSQEPNHQH